MEISDLTTDIRYIAPFAVWILLQMFLPTTAEMYATRSLATLVTALVCWSPLLLTRSNSTRSRRDIGNWRFFGVIVGLLVYGLWVWPDSFTWYRTWLTYPFGHILPASPSPYDPETCGWTLTVIKLVGSAFIIAPVEEVFFRGYLYHRLQRRSFRMADPEKFDLSAFLWVVFLFTLEHDRPLVAAITGVLYGILSIRGGLCAAIIAHVVTNFALGMHVILRGEWGFW